MESNCTPLSSILDLLPSTFCAPADSQGLLCTHSTKIYVLSSVSVPYTHCSGWGLRPTNPRVATVVQKVLQKILFFCVFAIMWVYVGVSVLPI